MIVARQETGGSAGVIMRKMDWLGLNAGLARKLNALTGVPKGQETPRRWTDRRERAGACTATRGLLPRSALLTDQWT